MADILIIGMEMPENEPLRLVLNPNGQLFIDHGVTFTEYEAVELPEHGDLISADDVQHVLDNLLKRTDDDAAIAFLKWAKDCVRVLPKIVPSNREDAK